MFRLGPWEIAIIVVVVVLVFGPKRLPELGKSIGEFITNFKSGLKGSDKNDKDKPA